jgi:hypothetical protein
MFFCLFMEGSGSGAGAVQIIRTRIAIKLTDPTNPEQCFPRWYQAGQRYKDQFTVYFDYLRAFELLFLVHYERSGFLSLLFRRHHGRTLVVRFSSQNQGTWFTKR